MIDFIDFKCGEELVWRPGKKTLEGDMRPKLVTYIDGRRAIYGQARVLVKESGRVARVHNRQLYRPAEWDAL